MMMFDIKRALGAALIGVALVGSGTLVRADARQGDEGAGAAQAGRALLALKEKWA